MLHQMGVLFLPGPLTKTPFRRDAVTNLAPQKKLVVFWGISRLSRGPIRFCPEAISFWRFVWYFFQVIRVLVGDLSTFFCIFHMGM